MFWHSPAVTIRPRLTRWLIRTELRLSSVSDRRHQPCQQLLTSHRRRSLVLMSLRWVKPTDRKRNRNLPIILIDSGTDNHLKVRVETTEENRILYIEYLSDNARSTQIKYRYTESVGIWESAIGTVTRLQAACLRNGGAIPGEGKFLFSIASTPVLGPNQFPIQWVVGAFPPEIQRPGSEDYHLHHLVARSRVTGAIPPLSIRLMAWTSIAVTLSWQWINPYNQF
jgi:hypothetical protein